MDNIHSRYEDNEDYIIYKPIKTKEAFDSNGLQFQGQGDRYKILSFEGYLEKICSDFKELINELKKSTDAWKINQLSI